VEDICFEVICPSLFYQLLTIWLLQLASGAANAEKTSLGNCSKNKARREAENT
jgi:hypothetical protein